MTPGGRVDHWTLTGSTTASPWVNAEFRLSERTRLRGGTGIYRQFPDLDEVHGIHGGGDELRPERALHVDAGIEQTLPRQTRILFNVYMREERDVLWAPGAEPQRLSNGTIQPGAFDAPWVNALSGDARGAEVVLRRDATDGFSGWAGYAFSRLRYTDTQTGESFWGDADQRHTLSLYGNYRLSSRTSVSARYRYGSNYPMRGYIGEPSAALGQRPMVDGRPLFYGLSPERNTLRLPAYSRLDVRADRAFTWSGRRLVVFVDVANVLNHNEPAQRQLLRRSRGTSIRDDGVAHAHRALGRTRHRVLIASVLRTAVARAGSSLTPPWRSDSSVLSRDYVLRHVRSETVDPRQTGEARLECDAIRQKQQRASRFRGATCRSASSADRQS